MRITVTFLASSLLLACTLGVAQQQNSDNSCGFVVAGDLSHPTVKGPNDIVPLVYVVEQPDSPLEVVSVDLEGMWLSVSNEQHTEHHCAKYTIRNRSDRTVQRFEIMLDLSTIGGAGGGFGASSSSPLPSGQVVEVKSCNGGGHESAKDNYIRLLVYVDKVDFEDCHYKPSLRIPRSLKVHTVW